MRKLIALSLPALLALALTYPAAAQDTKGSAKAPAKAPAKGAAKGASKGAAKGGATKAEAGKATKVSGIIKGGGSGKSFTLGTNKGPVKVDASGAKIRANGKFAGADVLKGGTQANVTGTMSGDTLKATDVDAHPKAAGGKKGGDKKGAADKKGGAAKMDKGGAAKADKGGAAKGGTTPKK